MLFRSLAAILEIAFRILAGNLTALGEKIDSFGRACLRGRRDRFGLLGGEGDGRGEKQEGDRG